jgi:hypothetical protein
MARQFGAEGIGLCRTEHMFFDAARISAVREMILAEDEAGRRRALAKLLPEQRADFTEIFATMAGLPCTIRLLDPPLHEFLPQAEAEFAELAEATGVAVDKLKRRAEELHEFNPMLGHRGCRLGITFPEIYEMQARAIFEAACEVTARGGDPVVPEVMIPLVGTRKELTILKALVDRVAAEVFAERGATLDYLVGTMIELPRAALMAQEIAEDARFFSFGTNDLTQTALGLSRDDASRFLDVYVAKGIFPRDPFVSLDVEGVGQLIALAVERGRAARPDIKLGICGEHGGDPASIAFCESVRPRSRQRLALPRPDRPPGRGAGGVAELGMPAAQGQDLEGLDHAALLVGPGGERPPGAFEPRLAERRRPRGEDIAEALCPEVRHKAFERAVSDAHRSAVRDRIGPPGALQQLRAGANVDHRVDPGGRSLAVGRQHDPAQRRQASGADEAGDGPSAGSQRPADMDQRAGKVVDRVERGYARDQVETAEGKGLLLVEALGRLGLGHLGVSESLGQRAGPVADHQCTAGLVAQEGEALERVLDHVGDHEPRRVRALLQPGDPAACRKPPGGREDRRRSAGHAPLLPLPARRRKQVRP